MPSVITTTARRPSPWLAFLEHAQLVAPEVGDGTALVVESGGGEHHQVRPGRERRHVGHLARSDAGQGHEKQDGEGGEPGQDAISASKTTSISAGRAAGVTWITPPEGAAGPPLARL